MRRQLRYLPAAENAADGDLYALLFKMAVQPQGVERFVQFDPQHKTAARPADAGAGREVFQDQIGHAVAVLLVAGAHAPQVLQIVPPRMNSAIASCGWVAVAPEPMNFMCSTRSR